MPKAPVQLKTKEPARLDLEQLKEYRCRLVTLNNANSEIQKTRTAYQQAIHSQLLIQEAVSNWVEKKAKELGVSEAGRVQIDPSTGEIRLIGKEQ